MMKKIIDNLLGIWYSIYYTIYSYIEYSFKQFVLGLTKKLKEEIDLFDPIKYSKNGMTICICLPEEYVKHKYFIVYNKRPYPCNLFCKMTRIRIDKPEYIKSKNIFRKRWILTEKEKRDLISLLSSTDNWNNCNTVWETVNERIELCIMGLGWNSSSGVITPPIPDYMKLPNK